MFPYLIMFVFKICDFRWLCSFPPIWFLHKTEAFYHTAKQRTPVRIYVMIELQSEQALFDFCRIRIISSPNSRQLRGLSSEFRGSFLEY